MFFKKDLGRKFFKLFRYVVLCSIPVLVLSSCSNSQKIKYWEENGKAAAFDHDNDVIIYLFSHEIEFYVDYSHSNPDYFDITSKAIKEVNDFTNIRFRINTSDSSLRNTITLKNEGNNGNYATTSISFNSSGEITKSNIVLNTYYLNGSSLSYKLQTVLHEFGHTLGLIDLYDNTIKEYSIMYGKDNLYMNFTDYQEFDIQNILWCYGGDHL